MVQNISNAAPVGGDAGEGGVSVSSGFQGQDIHAQGQRKGLRGALVLAFFFLSAGLSYGIVFVLIDKWYKGGSLGIL